MRISRTSFFRFANFSRTFALDFFPFFFWSRCPLFLFSFPPKNKQFVVSFQIEIRMNFLVDFRGTYFFSFFSFQEEADPPSEGGKALYRTTAAFFSAQETLKEGFPPLSVLKREPYSFHLGKKHKFLAEQGNQRRC